MAGTLAVPGDAPPRPALRSLRMQFAVGFKDPNNQTIMAGTFGALVGKGQRRFILSNNHVIADENKLPLGTPIYERDELGQLGNGAVVRRIARIKEPRLKEGCLERSGGEAYRLKRARRSAEAQWLQNERYGK